MTRTEEEASMDLDGLVSDTGLLSWRTIVPFTRGKGNDFFQQKGTSFTSS